MTGNTLDTDIVVVGATRSIVGATNGSLQNLSAAELGHQVLDVLLKQLEGKSAGFRRNDIQHFVLGICVGAGIGQNLPRQITQLCGMKTIESTFAINEMCGSGLESIILGMQALQLKQYPMAIVGGIEAPSQSPYLITQKQLIEWAPKKVEEIQTLVTKAEIHDALWCKMFDVHTIVHAENTTREWVQSKGLNPDEIKQQIDEYAVMSNDRALQAIQNGAFKDEIVVIPGTGSNDEIPKKKKLEMLLKRKGTQFTPDGIYLSSHNCPPLATAASFLMLMTYTHAKSLGLKPLARITGFARAGIEPEKFMLAPIQAVRKVLEKTGTKISDYDLFEMNTAFGSQILMNKIELGLDMSKVNIYGDCLALGHPIGAAGSRLMTTLIHAMNHKQVKRGLVAICLGGGNGLAMAVEKIVEKL